MKLSRREMLKVTAGVGLTAAAGRLAPLAAQPRQALNMITIPSSGQSLPHIGIGCRNYRGEANSEEMPVFKDTFRTYHEMGAKIIDTSPNYGNSEQVIGGIMRELGIRNDLWVATKVDREAGAEGEARMEESFGRLGGDNFDLMQVHNLRGVEVQLETLKAWKEQGRFRHIGITTSSARQYEAFEDVMRRHDMDFVQVNYSIGDRGAADRLIPLAQDRGMAVLVNLPFGRGRMFQAVGDRELPDWAADIDATSWGQVFLKYVMSAPGVVIPIPGTTKPHHAEDNVGAAMGRLPDAAMRAEMERFMDPLVEALPPRGRG